MEKEKDKQEGFLKTKLNMLNNKKLLVVLGVFVGLLLLLISILHINSYNPEYELKTIYDYWEQTNSKDKATIKNNQMIFTIPDNVMSSEMTLAFKRIDKKTRYKISNTMLDSNDKTIIFEGKLFGVSFPIKGEFSYKLEEGRLIGEIESVSIAKAVKLNKKNTGKMMKWLFSDNYPFVFDGKSFFENDMLLIKDIKWKESLFEVTIEIKEAVLIKELKEIQKNANQIVLKHFKEKGNEKEKLAAKLIETSQHSEADKELLYKDVFAGGDITAGILTICNQGHASKIFEKYKKALFPIEEAKVKQKREDTIFAGLEKYRGLIEDALNYKYFSEEKPYINKNKVYSVGLKEYPTPKILDSRFSLAIPKDIIDKMSFYYEKNSKSILITYMLDEQGIIVMDKNTYKVVNKSAIDKNSDFTDTGRVSPVNDKAIWDNIYKQLQRYYQEQAPLVRYMKADDRYAFVIASSSFAYQSFDVFAMKKEENNWEIIKQNIKTIEELNQEYPEFNLETATLDIERVKIYQLEEDMLQVMIDDMLNKKIVRDKTIKDIIFCSYGNDYIAFKMSDGKEYVYKVYRMYLHTILSKDQAIKNWPDLPEIITLQEKPVN